MKEAETISEKSEECQRCQQQCCRIVEEADVAKRHREQQHHHRRSHLGQKGWNGGRGAHKRPKPERKAHKASEHQQRGNGALHEPSLFPVKRPGNVGVFSPERSFDPLPHTLRKQGHAHTDRCRHERALDEGTVRCTGDHCGKCGPRESVDSGADGEHKEGRGGGGGVEDAPQQKTLPSR